MRAHETRFTTGCFIMKKIPTGINRSQTENVGQYRVYRIVARDRTCVVVATHVVEALLIDLFPQDRDQTLKLRPHLRSDLENIVVRVQDKRRV